MISVTLLTDEPGRLSIEAGHIDFFNLPVRTERDVQVCPRGVVSFETVKNISKVLPHLVRGKVSRYEWRRDPDPGTLLETFPTEAQRGRCFAAAFLQNDEDFCGISSLNHS